jgi:hypothetical protein
MPGTKTTISATRIDKRGNGEARRIHRDANREHDQRERVRKDGCADRDDDRFQANDTQPLDDRDAQQRVRSEQRSDHDRRNERIAKTEAKQGAKEQWHGGRKQAEDHRPGLRPAEEGNIDLEPG